MRCQSPLMDLSGRGGFELIFMSVEMAEPERSGKVCAVFVAAGEGGDTGPSGRPHRRDQRADSEQIDHSLHVVGEYLQAHLRAHPR